MQQNNKKTVLSLFTLISIIIILITIFNNITLNTLSILYIYAESNEKKQEEGRKQHVQPRITQEKNTLNEDFSIYEGLGIKLENFNHWTILMKSDKSTCDNIDWCILHLGILNGTNMPQTWIVQDILKAKQLKKNVNVT